MTTTKRKVRRPSKSKGRPSFERMLRDLGACEGGLRYVGRRTYAQFVKRHKADSLSEVCDGDLLGYRDWLNSCLESAGLLPPHDDTVSREDCPGCKVLDRYPTEAQFRKAHRIIMERERSRS